MFLLFHKVIKLEYMPRDYKGQLTVKTSWYPGSFDNHQRISNQVFKISYLK